ncbi:HalOD1 output domain-containing protein [Natronomonas sp.]|uniref:HalOD1 output domain-containing protein n=1 Tax=Natronomonas sp. TaxID=2184060 RepID=UPI002635F606|nr:HalOD1 output domain-containing protein [Natronomonas sp.]
MSRVTTRAGVDLESFEYHPESDTHRARYDRGTTPPSLAVIASVSKALNVGPTELEQLHYAVDSDALDELLRGREQTEREVSVRFTIEEHSITVNDRGVISITPSERDTDGSDPDE